MKMLLPLSHVCPFSNIRISTLAHKMYKLTSLENRRRHADDKMAGVRPSSGLLLGRLALVTGNRGYAEHYVLTDYFVHL